MKLPGIILSIIIELTLAVNSYSEDTWTTYFEGIEIRDVAVEKDFVWCASSQGVIRLDVRNGNYISYTSQNGLDTDDIKVVEIDDKGIKWFGTFNGVHSFNDEEWTLYPGVDINSPLLFNNQIHKAAHTIESWARNIVNALTIDHNGHVWAGFYGRLEEFDGQTWNTYTIADGLTDDFILSLAVDNNGYIWVGSMIGGAVYFDGHTWITYETEERLFRIPFGDQHIYMTDVQAIVSDKKNKLWLCSWDYVACYDGPETIVYTSKDDLTDARINAAAVDTYNNKWFGTENGVACFDDSTWTCYSTTDGLVDNNVLCVTVDHMNRKWFGTKNGLSRYDENIITDMESVKELPSEIVITGNYPNPFNPETMIEFVVPHNTTIDLVVYNVSGQKVSTLLTGKLLSGNHTVLWNGKDDRGQPVSSGIYFACLRSASQVKNHRMILIR